MWLDACAVVVIALSAWKGAVKGAVWQLAVLGSIALCILVAGEAAPRLEEQIPLAQPIKHWLAIAAVYAGISLVVFVVARTIRGWLEKVRFVEYDRHWGAILGGIKGALLVLVITGLLLILAPSTHEMIRESVTGAVTNQAVRYAAPLLPAKVVFALQNAINSANEPSIALPIPEQFRLTL